MWWVLLLVCGWLILRGRKASAAEGPVVYIDGIFDLFHEGHVQFMKKALAVGGPGARLLVGVITDEDAGWKREPIMRHTERVSVVKACRHAWGVIEYPPLVLNEEFIERHKIQFVVHGDDDKQEKFFRIPIEKGIMRYVPYHDGVSTTEILKRVRRGMRASPFNTGA